MGWDDAPPTTEELGSSSGWDSTPPTKEELAPEPTTDDFKLGKTKLSHIEQFGKNAASDVVGQAKGMGEMVNAAYPFLGTLGKDVGLIPKETELPNAAQVLGGMAKGIPREAQRIGLGELVTGHPINSVEKAANAFYDKPLTTGMDFAGLEGAVEGIGNAALKATDLPSYIERASQNAAVKNVGASPMQARQMGPEATRSLGQFTLDKGITSPFTGDIGMENKINSIHEQAGSQIGDIRKLADTKSDPPNIEGIERIVRQQLDAKYTKGIQSGQAGSYAKALEELRRAEPTHQGLADLSTELHRAATKATKLKEDPSAIVDVANTISKLNNDMIKTKVPEHAASYDAALKDFGATSKLKQMNLRKQSREVSGRIGPGGPVREVTQKFLDSIGYRAGASVANKLAKFLKENPDVEGAMPESFKDAAMHVEAPEDFEGLGMSKGGVVPNEISRFINSRRKQPCKN